MRGVEHTPEYSEDPLPENHPRFTDESGWVDSQKYLNYLESIEIEDSEPDPTVSEVAMLDFCLARYREASMVEAHGLLPNDIPYNQQPWWKLETWEAYWSGLNRGRNAEYESNIHEVKRGGSRGRPQS